MKKRVMHADGRFARRIEFIFFGQFAVEVKMMMSNMSIALRKGKGDQATCRVDVQTLTNKETLKKLFQADQGFKFLHPI